MIAVVNQDNKLEVYTNKNDLCYSCQNGSKCPLVQGLYNESIFLHYADTRINECGLYKK